MKFTLILSFLFFSLRSILLSAPTIKIVQPYENANIPAVEASFVFGSVIPTTASVFINGIEVKPHRNGGFITMIPYSSGTFKIEAVAFDGSSSSTVTRTVQVGLPSRSFDVKSDQIILISPPPNIVVRAGDLVNVIFQAAPNSTGTFRIGAETPQLPALEQPGKIRGIYKGIYRVQSSDRFDNHEISLSIKRTDGERINKKSGAHITVQRRVTPRIVELFDDSVLLTGPGTDYGYMLFPMKGTRMEVVGEWGEYFRISAGTLLAWVKKSNVFELPTGTIISQSIAHNLRVTTTASSTIIELPLQARHIHQIREMTDPNRLELTLWGVTADTDRIRYRVKNSIVKHIDWRQQDPATFVLDIDLNRRFPWGYDVRYEDNMLVLEIRHRPLLGFSKTSRLKGLKVAIDPGHGPQNYGTIGPLGNTEASVVQTVADVVKNELIKRGADVIITRDTKDMNLKARTDLAWKEKAHVFISLHCDATPEGQDPRILQGYSVHYYSVQSRLLAEYIHKTYGEKTSITDQGLWRSNLAVCRTTQMPAILFELGFLVIPEFEELVMTRSFQEKIADSIATAIEMFALKAE